MDISCNNNDYAENEKWCSDIRYQFNLSVTGIARDNYVNNPAVNVLSPYVTRPSTATMLTVYNVGTLVFKNEPKICDVSLTMSDVQLKLWCHIFVFQYENSSRHW